MSAQPQYRYSLTEYLQLDNQSVERYEFWDGEVVCMSGGSPEHAEIAANLLRTLGNLLEEQGCRAVGSDLRVKTPAAPPYRYPDVTVYCGQRELEEVNGQKMLVNPILIIEVLSPTTAAIDHGDKFIAYKSIKTLREYLLVEQDKPRVTHYLRQPDDTWQRTDIIGLEESLILPSVACLLSLRKIYQNIF